MDFRKKSSVLIASVVFIISGIQGQIDDFMKICDLCNVNGLQDCNSTNIFPINMTINCDMTNRMCTLGINEFFEGFENLTMHDIDEKHICIFKEFAKDSLEMSSNDISTESFKNIKSTIEPIYVKEITETSVMDEVTFLSTIFGDELIKSSTLNALPTENYENQVKRSTTPSPIDLFDHENENSTLENEERHLLEESLNMQQDEPNDPTMGDLKDIPDDTITCFACESSKNEACLGRIEELDRTHCPKPGGCISYYANGELIRTCGSSFPPDKADLCRSPHNFSCDWCPTSDCNKKLWKQCFTCNSKDNPNCALWSNAETVPFAVCPNYNDNCLVRVTKDGDTLRECAKPEIKCSEEELCLMCEGPMCNAGVYPPNRLQCIQCEECEDAQDPNNALPCLHYNENEKCFLYVTSKSKMIRGCVSNITEMKECHNNEPKCKTCAKVNGCNSTPLMKEPTLSCSKCKTKDSPSCVWQQSETSISKCVNKFLYYLTETCLTQFNPSTEEAVRDCSFDYGTCTPEDEDCQSCSENGCNRHSLKIQECIQCQSDQPGQSECQNKAKGIPPTKCPLENQTYENRGCFTITKGNITSRGCYASLSKHDQGLCKKKGQTSCKTCMTDSCNIEAAPSTSSKLFQLQCRLIFNLIIVFIILF